MAHDRPGHYNDDMSGLAAFRAALKRQEGQFMRGATLILNSPKDLSTVPHQSAGKQLSQDVASAILERNASGQFIKKD
jgi:hypothetical protein